MSSPPTSNEYQERSLKFYHIENPSYPHPVGWHLRTLCIPPRRWSVFLYCFECRVDLHWAGVSHPRHTCPCWPWSYWWRCDRVCLRVASVPGSRSWAAPPPRTLKAVSSEAVMSPSPSHLAGLRLPLHWTAGSSPAVWQLLHTGPSCLWYVSCGHSLLIARHFLLKRRTKVDCHVDSWFT